MRNHLSASDQRHTPIMKCMAVVCIFLYLSGCIDDDYKLYNTEATITGVTPKIRVLNLNFKQQSVSVKIGGATFGEKLVHRRITAYTETSASLLGDSVIQVYNGEGALLYAGKLHLTSDHHYTIAIVPAYERVRSSYVFNNRWMMKARTDSAEVVVIADPLQPPFKDRTAVRHVALAIDQAQHYAWTSNTRLPVLGVGFTAYPWANHRLNIHDDYFEDSEYMLTQAELSSLPVSSWPASREYDPMNPPRYQVGLYSTTDPKTTRIFSTGAYSTDGGAIGDPPPFVTTPFTFEGGASYSVITNGTQGVTNDVSEITEGSLAVPLDNIPYEVYVINDADDRDRILATLPQSHLNQVSTNIGLVHLNEYGERIVTLAIDGAVEKRNYLTVNGQSGVDMIRSSVSGDHAASIVSGGSVLPVLASADVQYKPGLYYMHFYYGSDEDHHRLKVLEVDTVFTPGKLRVNVLHLIEQMGPVKILNAATGAVLVPSVDYTHTSSYLELPIRYNGLHRDGSWNKSVDALRIVKADGDEFLVEAELSPLNAEGGTGMLIDPLRKSKGTLLTYTLVLYGGPNALYKDVIGLSRVVPETSREVGIMAYTSMSRVSF